VYEFTDIADVKSICTEFASTTIAVYCGGDPAVIEG